MNTRSSSLNRLFQCSGCQEAADGIESTSSPASLMGDKVHNALHMDAIGDPIPELDGREEFIFQEFKNKWDHSVMLLEEKHGEIITPIELQCEPYFECEIGGHMLTGHIDRWCQFEDGHVFLNDYKCGFKEQVKAHESRQLQGYIVLIDANTEMAVTGVTAMISSAGDDGDNRFIPCYYTVKNIENIKRVFSAKFTEAETSPVRKIGSECFYCPANGSYDRCPESCKGALELVKLGKGNIEALTCPLQLKTMLEAIKAIKAMETQVKARIDTMYANNEEDMSEFFEEKRGARKLIITDSQKAHKVLVSHELLSTPDFLKCVSVSAGGTGIMGAVKPELINLGIKVFKHKEYIETLLVQEGCAEVKQNNSSIVIKK